MNRLPLERRAQILGMLVEGNSFRATGRLADVSINTTTKLLLDVAQACEEYQDRTLRGLKCRRLQCDEIWSFVYAKAKNVPQEHAGEFGYGDVWTFTAIDADTKLVPSWAVGRRDAFTANAFIRDLADRLTHRVQITTDGNNVYLEAVEGAFGVDVDYAMLVKLYEGDARQDRPETRYSPGKCTGTRTVVSTSTFGPHARPKSLAFNNELSRPSPAPTCISASSSRSPTAQRSTRQSGSSAAAFSSSAATCGTGSNDTMRPT